MSSRIVSKPYITGLFPEPFAEMQALLWQLNQRSSKTSSMFFFYKHTYTQTHSHIFTYISLHICIYMYVYMYIHMYIYIYTYLYVYMYIYIGIYKHVYICVYVYIYIHVRYSHTNSHIQPLTFPSTPSSSLSEMGKQVRRADWHASKTLLRPHRGALDHFFPISRFRIPEIIHAGGWWGCW